MKASESIFKWLSIGFSRWNYRSNSRHTE